MYRILLPVSFLISLVACQVKPQPINYGSDSCHFCKMTIVDNQHSAELVTVKGKAFKYDAIECMVNDLHDWDQAEVKYHLIADYSDPGKLIDATSSHFVISQAIPSPMGRYLTGFGNAEKRNSVLKDARGEALDWQQLRQYFQENP